MMLMSLNKIILCLIFAISLTDKWTWASEDALVEWNYGDLGPDEWVLSYEHCKGDLQSPINIVEELAEYDSNLKPFKFNNYNETNKWNFTNNGHTIVFTPSTGNTAVPLTINGSDFYETYYLQNVHLHWGENDYQGSEHLVNGHKHPLEMHLVHKSKSNNVTVLGILFQISAENNTNLNTLLDAIDLVININATTISQFALEDLLGGIALDKYYRYLGSLTTPPCTEGIIWNLFIENINVSHYQMKELHKVNFKKNFRETQELHHRKLLSSVKVTKPDDDYENGQDDDTSSAFTIKTNCGLLIVLVLNLVVSLYILF